MCPMHNFSRYQSFEKYIQSTRPCKDSVSMLSSARVS